MEVCIVLEVLVTLEELIVDELKTNALVLLLVVVVLLLLGFTLDLGTSETFCFLDDVLLILELLRLCSIVSLELIKEEFVGIMLGKAGLFKLLEDVI